MKRSFVNIINIVIFSIFLFILCPTSFGQGTPKDKLLFLKAEKIFNIGQINEAKEIYLEFIRTFPTSQFRQIAETQLTKCNQILELQIELRKYQGANEFEKARESCSKIFSINPKAIDTSAVFQSLRLLEQEYLNNLQAEEDAFIQNINAFLSMIVSAQFQLSNYVMEASLNYKKANEAMVNDEELITRMDKIQLLYVKIKIPPAKYAWSAYYIKCLYDYFQETQQLLRWANIYDYYTVHGKLKAYNSLFDSCFKGLKSN